MIVPKLVSSKVCVESFYSKTGIQSELSDDDIRLWTSELVELINYPLQYLPKIIGSKVDSRYNFTNYTVPLPCDFYKLIPSGILVDGYPVRWRTNSFHYLMDGDCCNLDDINSTIHEEFNDQFGNTFSPQNGTMAGNLIERDVTFDITDNRIVFNIAKGDVCMAYWSIPVDNEGYVMIPDTAKYRRAVTDYLIWCNDYILFRQGVIGKDLYQIAENNKMFSIGSAANELKMPDVEQMESMKNSIIRLLPAINQYNSNFRMSGLQEKRYIR
jgi:hypothetical protein